MGARLAAAATAAALTAAQQAHPELPPNSLQYLPILQDQTRRYWPEMTDPSLLAGQIEQETCISLTSKKCWSKKAELKTARERGVGLGQITKTKKFDSLKDLRALFPDALAKFTWRSPYDPQLQIRALVLKDRYNYQMMSFAAAGTDRMAFTFAAYNGGTGGVITDRRLCAETEGCEPSHWYEHVEKTSFKANTAVKGYGQSFFCINRYYPWRIMFARSIKYRAYFEERAAGEAAPPSPSLYGC